MSSEPSERARDFAARETEYGGVMDRSLAIGYDAGYLAALRECQDHFDEHPATEHDLWLDRRIQEAEENANG